MANKPDFVKTDNLAKLMKQIADMSKQEILVGIPDSGPERRDGDVSNAQLAYIHEFGAPAANIPARPFMIPGIEDAKDRINTQLEKGSRALMDGDLDGANKAMNAAGLIAVSSIKSKIVEGDFAPLAPATIAAKGSDHALIDSAQMMNAITYVIVGAQEKE
jgi:hypothetical protein